jgi:hypothetical protein
MKKGWIIFILLLMIVISAYKALEGLDETPETEDELIARQEQKDEETSLENPTRAEAIDPAPRDEDEISVGPDEEIESIEENPTDFPSN